MVGCSVLGCKSKLDRKKGGCYIPCVICVMKVASRTSSGYLMEEGGRRYELMEFLSTLNESKAIKMGNRLIILMGLLLGVLYCIHLLVQDYQALSAPRLLRFLFKRDINAQSYTKPHVRWRRILLHDPIQCARLLYCDLGTSPSDTEPRKGFVAMLKLEPHAEDKLSHEVFAEAYESGKLNSDATYCKKKYYMCPFDSGFLFEIIQYLLKT